MITTRFALALSIALISLSSPLAAVDSATDDWQWLEAGFEARIFGSADFDYSTAMVLGLDGDIYVAGRTQSATWGIEPTVVVGPAPGAGRYHAFVARLAPDTTTLKALIVFGGSADDGVMALATGADGSVYAVGNTRSSDFPFSGNAWSDEAGGEEDVFVVRIDAALTTLLAGTRLAGDDYDQGRAIAIDDSTGDVLITGNTASADFPVTDDAILKPEDTLSEDSSFDYGMNVFVARFNPDLTQLRAATLLGGGGDEQARGIVVARDGRVIVSGNTRSSDFPRTPGPEPFAENRGPRVDIFVTALSPDLDEVIVSSVWGGTNLEKVTAIAVDQDERVLVTGYTNSVNFPTTPGAFVPGSPGGRYSGFVVRLSPDLRRVDASTYLGGPNMDFPRALAVAPTGRILIAGSTFSVHEFAVAFSRAPSDMRTDKLVGFVCVLDDQLRPIALIQPGGRGIDDVRGVVGLADGNFAFAGRTDSPPNRHLRQVSEATVTRIPSMMIGIGRDRGGGAFQ